NNIACFISAINIIPLREKAVFARFSVYGGKELKIAAFTRIALVQGQTGKYTYVRAGQPGIHGIHHRKFHSVRLFQPDRIENDMVGRDIYGVFGSQSKVSYGERAIEVIIPRRDGKRKSMS